MSRPPKPSAETPPDLNDPVTSSDAPFLARRSYVQRRMGDAARLLPVVGVLLFLLPLLWLIGSEAPRTARGVLYVFLVWSGLIVVAAWLAPRLMASPPDTSEPPELRQDRKPKNPQDGP
jgi:hypothetical protein